MKSTKQPSIGTVDQYTNSMARRMAPCVGAASAASSGTRTTARDYANPVDYRHPYESMKERLAEALALRNPSAGSKNGI